MNRRLINALLVFLNVSVCTNVVNKWNLIVKCYITSQLMC